jgi:Domain of unknown function (DUF4910)/winged helix-turn-helix
MAWVDGKAFWLFLPASAHVFIRCEALERVESPGEMIGLQEGLQMRFQVAMGVVVVLLNGGILERAVHAFHLPVRPGMVGFGEPMVDAMLLTDAINNMLQGIDITLTIGELNAMISQPGLNLIGHSDNHVAEELSRDHCVGFGVLKHSGGEYSIIDFFPYGHDERQFCSPGFNLPVGCVVRTPYGRYPEYHTSADNLSFIQLQSLMDSFAKCLEALYILESNKTYLNQNPKGEPQLGRRGLFHMIGGHPEQIASEFAMLWVLNLSDGHHTLPDIAERSGMPFSLIKAATDTLTTPGLLKECSEQVG